MNSNDKYIKRFMEEGRVYQTPYGPDCYKPSFKKRETFDTLFKWAVERKRGKIRYAKSNLTSGFYYYSYSQQVKIIKAFLFSCPSDRKFAYKKLRVMWSDCFVGILERSWNEFHDEECGWLITRFFPKGFLIENLDTLSTPYNYFFLCKRLGGENWFVPEESKFKDNISIIQYLEALSMTQYPVSEDKANELLWRMVSVAVYGHIANNEQMETKWGPILQDEHGHDLTLTYWFRFPDFIIYNNDNFKEVLVYLCLMDLKKPVQNFCQWCECVRRKYEENVGFLEPSNSTMTGKAFLETIVEMFPSEYEYMLNFESFQTNTWLNDRWKIMLHPQRRKRYGKEYSVPLVDVNNIPHINLEVLNPDPIRRDIFTNEFYNKDIVIDLPF